MKSLFQFFKKGDSIESQQENEEEERKKNYINEIQFLEKHSDIIRFLIKIDETKY